MERGLHDANPSLSDRLRTVRLTLCHAGRSQACLLGHHYISDLHVRPLPDCDTEGLNAWFAPAEDLAAWARRSFIDPDGLLANEVHAHLEQATVGFLWTNVSNAKKACIVIGTSGTATNAAVMIAATVSHVAAHWS